MFVDANALREADARRDDWVHRIFGQEFRRPVTAVSFTGDQITDGKLKEIGRFHHLNTLKAVGAEITDDGFSHLQNLRDLRWLNLKATPLTDESVTTIEEFAKLEVLDLSHTEITDEGLQQLALLPCLKQLHIFDTRVTREGVFAYQRRYPNVLIFWSPRSTDQLHGALCELVQLGADYSCLSDPALDVVSLSKEWTGGNEGLALLQDAVGVDCVWIIGWTGLSRAGIQHLRCCSSLTTIHLRSAGANDAHLLELGKHQGLVELHVGGPAVTDAGVAHLSALTSLQRLTIVCSPGVTGKSMQELAQLPSLNYLVLEYNGLKDLDVAKFKHFPELTELHLSGSFTAAAIVHLVQLKQLKRLVFQPTPQLSEKQWEQLRDGLPDCEMR